MRVSWYVTLVWLREQTLFLDSRNPGSVKPAMDAILRHTGQCNVMHNAWKHSLCIPSQESFTFQLRDRWPLQVQLQHETKLDLSLVISSLIFSDFGRKLYFSSYILKGFHLTFCSVSAFVFAQYNEHFVLFCFRFEIQMSTGVETFSKHSLPCQKLKRN